MFGANKNNAHSSLTGCSLLLLLISPSFRFTDHSSKQTIMSPLSEGPVNARALAKRDSGSTTALIAAAVVSCVVVAMLSAGGLWIYQRWLVSLPYHVC